MDSTQQQWQQKLTEIDRELVELLKRRVQAERAGSQLAPASSDHDSCNADESNAQASAQSNAQSSVLVQQWIDHAASLSRRLAFPSVSIVYLGPIYSFSYLAAAKYFGLGANLVPVNTISAAFEEVQRKQATFAVVPVENNTDGRIVDTLGMFAKSPVKICGEILLPIHHCLLGRCQRSEIVEVHSKPQALSQCRHWLATHLPEARLVEVASTAEAASTAAKSPGVAAIASHEAGIHHGCQVIAENIEDNSQNVTRFAVIGDRSCIPTGNDKTSLMMQLSHRPGSLADAMMVFKQSGVNLTWIESFPLPNRPNEYLFFVELEGHLESQGVQNSISQLGVQSVRLDVLGSYPKGLPV